MCARVPTHVDVVIRNARSEPVAEVDAAAVAVELLNESGAAVAVQVTRGGGGRLRVAYTPQAVGVHRLGIAVGGVPIAGSPWQVVAVTAAVRNIAALSASGLSTAEFKAAGYTATELKAAGYPLAELKAAGYTARELGAPGARFTQQELSAAGFSRTLGAISAQDMRDNYPNQACWGVGSNYARELGYK